MNKEAKFKITEVLYKQLHATEYIASWKLGRDGCELDGGLDMLNFKRIHDQGNNPMARPAFSKFVKVYSKQVQ